MLIKRYLSFLLLMTAMLAGCNQSTPDAENSADKNGQSIVSESGAKSDTDNKSMSGSEARQVNDKNVDLRIQDISEREFGKINALAVLFSAPLEPNQDFLRYIHLTPSLGEPVLSEDGRKLYFTGLEPEVSYTIDIGKGIKGIHGKTLSSGEQKELQARAMSPTVSFETEGAVMMPGETEALPVMAINAPEAELNIYRVKEDSVSTFFDYYEYNDNYLEDYLTHIYTARIKTGESKNTRNRVLVELDTIGKVKEPGVYFATLAKPGAFSFDSSTWFTVSSIGLHIRKYRDHTRLIAQNIATGKLLSEVDISVLDSQSKLWTKGVTDQDGSFVFRNNFRNKENRKTPYLILARNNNEVTALEYHAPSFDLSEFDVSGRSYQATEMFVYSGRDIYRPGESATFSVLKRDQDGQPVEGPVNIEIFKPGGQRFKNWLVESAVAGYHEVTLDIPSGVPTGTWRAEVHSPASESGKSRFNFKVEEFLPERLKLSFNQGLPALTSFVPDDGLQVRVLGEYLYGAPAAGNRLDANMRVRPWGMPFSQLKEYIFGNPDFDRYDMEELQTVELKDDGTTITRVSMKNYDWREWPVPAQVTLQYSLYETGGRAINRNVHTLLWPRESFVGVKPLFKDLQSDSNGLARFNLVRANRLGETLLSGEAKIELYREEVKYFWTYTRSRGWHYQRDENEYLASSAVVDFSSVEGGSLDLPVDWGRYRLEVTDLQSQGKTTVAFHAGEDWYSSWNSDSDQIRPDQVRLALNNKSFKAGDTAQVRISAPTEGTAVIMLESDEVLFITEAKLFDKQAEVSVPIPVDIARHDLYVSAFVVAPTDSTEKVAKRSFGIIPLPMNRDDRKLNIDIDVPEKWRPEQQVIADVSVLDATGNPVNGDVYLTLSAVDSGVLSVTGYKVREPHTFFYGQRKYSSSITDMFDDILEYKMADAAEQRWGGDADLTRGGDKPKTDVQIVSLFSHLVKVVNGKAEVPLNLPPFEGELQLTAVGFSQDDFGIDRESVKVASPVVIQLSQPGFLATGDQATLALDFVNMNGKPEELSIAVKTSGALNSHSIDQTFTLADGEKKVVYFDVDAGNLAGVGTVSVTVTLAGEVLERNWTLGVRNGYPSRYNIVSSVLSKGEAVTLEPELLSGLIPVTIHGQLRVGKLPDLQVADHWRYLTEYPYSCLEQTTSKTLPFAVTGLQDTLSRSNIDFNPALANEKVADALARYDELQRSNGSFGLWSKTSPEEHWLTVYATEFLFDLKRAGYEVPERMLHRATRRIKQYVTQRTPLLVKRWTDNPSHYNLAYRSYAAYVLAKEGLISLGPVRDIVENNLSDAKSPLPGVHLAMATLYTGDMNEGFELVKNALQLQRDPELYLGDYGSVIRDQAAVIYTLLQEDVLKEDALELLLSLHRNLLQKQYLSPQERSALFKLANKLEAISASDAWSGELITSEQQITLDRIGDYVRNFQKDEVGQKPRFMSTSHEPLFTSFAYSGVPTEMPEDVNNGIEVRSRYYRVEQGKATLIEDIENIENIENKRPLTVGDLVMVRISVTAASRIPDALLVNLMPAGLELENQNLDNALKLEDIRLEGETVASNARFEYQEYRDDRYVAALDLGKKREQVVFFIARAVNPGSYIAPPAMVESMYTPDIHGVSNAIGKVRVVNH